MNSGDFYRGGEGYCQETIANEMQRDMGRRGEGWGLYEEKKNLAKGGREDEGVHYQGGMFDFH